MMQAESTQRASVSDRWNRGKMLLFGNRNKTGILFKIFVYTMLIATGFIFLYPILHMFVTSFMSLTDLLDDAVRWVPTRIALDNYEEAMRVMNFREAIWPSIQLSLLPALGQTAVCALTGYGFSRFKFKGRGLLFALVILTYIVPQHVMMVPKYLMFTDYQLIGTAGAQILPALLGQGLYSAIFVLIFAQFFSQTPLSLDEAARVDGAGELRIFFKIAIPLAAPAFIISILFSVVWYWNETYFSSLFLGGSGAGTSPIRTLLMELNNFEESYKRYMQEASGSWASGSSVSSIVNEAIVMAGTMLSISPLLVLYFLLQRYFVESVDRSGITGE